MPDSGYRATADNRPSDQGAPTVTRCPRARRLSISSGSAFPSTVRDPAAAQHADQVVLEHPQIFQNLFGHGHSVLPRRIAHGDHVVSIQRRRVQPTQPRPEHDQTRGALLVGPLADRPLLGIASSVQLGNRVDDGSPGQCRLRGIGQRFDLTEPAFDSVLPDQPVQHQEGDLLAYLGRSGRKGGMVYADMHPESLLVGFDPESGLGQVQPLTGDLQPLFERLRIGLLAGPELPGGVRRRRGPVPPFRTRPRGRHPTGGHGQPVLGRRARADVPGQLRIDRLHQSGQLIRRRRRLVRADLAALGRPPVPERGHRMQLCCPLR